ncbi:MAG: GTPase Era [Clostridia bacterium]|nr:GTPase Era [Clostridia bacterium]
MKAAYISIVGRPNVGKSTLLNAILGEKIAIVSKKPQTTRNRIMGVHTVGETQFVFLDTPGIHTPRTDLGKFMVDAAKGAIGDADLAVLVVEPHGSVGDIEAKIISRIRKCEIPAILVINKTDMFDAKQIGDTILAYSQAFDFVAVVPMSAKNGQGIDILISEADKFTAEMPWLFPEDMITDQPDQVIAGEVIREKILRTLNREVPHGTAVVIEEFLEEPNMLRIRANIFCEKESHKGIIIGNKGATLKLIGTKARVDLEEFFGCKVFLDLWVKVKENWRDNPSVVRNFGYRKD